MFANKLMSFKIAIYCDYNFFEQSKKFRTNLGQLNFMGDNKFYERDYFYKAGKLDADFYCRNNVIKIARQLLGKTLCTNFNNQLTAARIVETEAYLGVGDKASHAWNGRRTKRTEVMYAKGGVAYVYLCYGIHHLFNVITNYENIPHAVLIRAAEPIFGLETMLERTNKIKNDLSITKGPGNLSKALGITTLLNRASLYGDDVFIINDGFKVSLKNIIATPRIGVDYAGEDAWLPYRFYINGNTYVSSTK